ncbi:MAG: fibronectin type III domain-containing protein [Lachnospira sp.]|nr:fibronectin type III domain-containing protein [Lachnospira sp.]
MKNRLRKRCISFVIAVVMLASVGAVNVQTAKAADYLYGGFAVTALSDTSVTIDYRNLYYDLEGYVTVNGWKVRVSDQYGNSQDMQTAAPNQVIYTIGGLTPGVRYTIEVMMMRTWLYSGEADEGYTFVAFTTPSAGIGTVDVVTQTPPTTTQAPTTQTPYVPTTPTVDTPYAVQPSTPSVKQPTIKTSKCKIKKNSIYLKWGKVKNAKSYTIYMRKEGAKKWVKVKKLSASKTSYKITKFKGKNINVYKQDYEVTVMATAKINGKTYNSPKSKYIRTYTYYY